MFLRKILKRNFLRKYSKHEKNILNEIDRQLKNIKSPPTEY
jgi:hypothetical protein